jgi:Variant SH3 domain.
MAEFSLRELFHPAIQLLNYLTIQFLDVFQVYGTKDSDGFYWGELKGRRGYVPHNMVVEVDDVSKVRGTE